MPDDKTQIGFSEEARDRADHVKEVLGIPQMQDLYRLGISIALVKSLAPTAEQASRTTAYAIQGVDPEGVFRAAIEQLRPDHGGRPVALAERLAEVGIADLAAHLQAGKPLRAYLQDVAPLPDAVADAASLVAP
jgi:hypothetical protein